MVLLQNIVTPAQVISGTFKSVAMKITSEILSRIIEILFASYPPSLSQKRKAFVIFSVAVLSLFVQKCAEALIVGSECFLRAQSTHGRIPGLITIQCRIAVPSAQVGSIDFGLQNE